jgi:hypothetical protein
MSASGPRLVARKGEDKRCRGDDKIAAEITPTVAKTDVENSGCGMERRHMRLYQLQRAQERLGTIIARRGWALH